MLIFVAGFIKGTEVNFMRIPRKTIGKKKPPDS